MLIRDIVLVCFTCGCATLTVLLLTPDKLWLGDTHGSEHCVITSLSTSRQPMGHARLLTSPYLVIVPPAAS
jgi:hypothetical protein